MKATTQGFFICYFLAIAFTRLCEVIEEAGDDTVCEHCGPVPCDTEGLSLYIDAPLILILPCAHRIVLACVSVYVRMQANYNKGRAIM